MRSSPAGSLPDRLTASRLCCINPLTCRDTSGKPSQAFGYENGSNLTAGGLCLDGLAGSSNQPPGAGDPVAMAEWIQRDLAKVGIRVKLETFDWITYLAKMFQGLRPGHGAYQLSWGMTSNFWIDIVARSTRQPDKGVNVGWYANPKVDGLLDTARVELDDKKRAAVYKQIDRIIMEEDASFFPICNDLNLVVLSPKVKGFVNPPEEWFQLWTPWVEA